MDQCKKLLALLLAAAMVLSMAACGRSEQPETGSAQQVQVTQPAGEQPADVPASTGEQNTPQKEESPATPQEVPAETAQKETEPSREASHVVVDDTDRESLEQIVDLLDKNDSYSGSVSQLGDADLEQLVTDLLQQGEQVEMPESQEPSVELDPDAYDEDGAMKEPFDQVYPELIEQDKVEYDDETLLIKLASDTITDGMAAAGVAALDVVVPMEGNAWYEAKLVAGTDATAAVEALRALDEVILVEYNYQIRTSQIDAYKPYPDDKDFSGNKHEKDQWHMHHCGIPDGMGAMKTDGGDSSVVVAVIDTGVDYDHEDLAQNIWINQGETPNNGMDDDGNGYVDDYYGVNIITGSGNGDDDNGHGTHVAGIIAAQNNNLGTVGIAYNVKIMPIKAAMASGYLHQSDIARAIYYAYENGAEIINMSFGGTACSIAVQDALAVAYTRCVLVASAGNDGAPNEGLLAIPNYPAALTYVLGVMSVDQYGVESTFTNYDVVGFNGVEYELYAPGTSIMSTLPDNRYGILSGTSMAAPVVSAMAAILRSEFTDRDMYPTKFIYGQLASTSEYHATCLDPEAHGLHNLPQIVDLNAALTKLPVPEVNVQDHALFDTEGFAQDANSRNNGDGAIDAGETIALGLTLRNRWGMSKDTTVSIDTLSMAGIPDPYITILNDTVNYGSVGTYSTQDCGRIYTDELLTGWENPFYIHIAEDCPNDYIFRINVTVTCGNALNENDTAQYTSVSTIELEVRNGTVLPNVIDEDMVLTADHLYIIPVATVILPDVTVRVEPGTHIQFWSNDADDPYAEDYVAYLRVEGNFLVEGTKENPVCIYPSDLHYDYVVDMGTVNEGIINLTYADVTNLSRDINASQTKGITNAYGCVFRNNTSQLFGRAMESGNVVLRYAYRTDYKITQAENCVFYKIGSRWGNTSCFSGTAVGCAFVDCGINYNEASMRNCLFYGNYFKDLANTDAYSKSSITLSDPVPFNLNEANISVTYRPETGTTYLAIRTNISNADLVLFQAYIRKLGGDRIAMETAEECAWLMKNLPVVQKLPGDGNSYTDYYAYYNLGITYDFERKAYVWGNGETVETLDVPDVYQQGSFRFVEGVLTDSTQQHPSHTDSCYRHAYYDVYELPGEIYLTDITLPEYELLLDMQTDYQLTVSTKPVNVEPEELIFESRDENVVTVDASGRITPVAAGTADVYIYSADRAVSNYVTVTVRDYVALESIHFPSEYAEIAAGDAVSVSCLLIPADTTRRTVTYSSSDPSVAQVDKYGHLTGISSGEAVITATAAEPAADGQPISAAMTVKVYNEATSIQLASIACVASLTDGTAALPEVVTSAAAEAQLVWRSTDTGVAEIVDGQIVLKQLGTSTLEVTDLRSGLSASCLLLVQEQPAAAVEKMYISGYYHYVLLENGQLYYWDNYNHKEPYVFTDVADFAAYGDMALILLESGIMERRYVYNTDPTLQSTIEVFAGMEITDLAYSDSSCYCLVNGNVYSWGNNYSGQLGVGIGGDVSEPTLVNLDNVVQVAAGIDTAYFLTAEGDLYYSGCNENMVYSPTLLIQGVSELYENSIDYSSIYVQLCDGRYGHVNVNGYSSYVDDELLYQMDTYDAYHQNIIGIRDGQVYTFYVDGPSGESVTKIPGISNAVDVFISNDDVYYVRTEDNLLLAFGNNAVGFNHMLGMSSETKVETPVVLPIQGLTEETMCVTSTNLDTENILTDSELVLTFNKSIGSAGMQLYADGTQVTVNNRIEDLNRLVISRGSGFEAGVAYRLVIPAGSLKGAASVVNKEEIAIEFAYEPRAEEILPEEGTEETVVQPVIREAVLDESVERFYWTAAEAVRQLTEQHSIWNWNPRFMNNVILNRISTDTEVSHWLRPQGGNVYSSIEVPIGGNYWGTVNETAIGLQIIDYSDYPNYARLNYAPFLTEAPEDVFPFVTGVTVFNKNGEAITTVSNEEVTFRVTFNRDMDTSMPLTFRFGSAYPFGDYAVPGDFVDARTWEGKYLLTTVIENGYQYFSISDGRTADGKLDLWPDVARFFFELDTTAAQALIMQGSATDTGIQLTWTQDDFDTLMGYNVYRATSEDGYYQRLNSSVIPAETKEFFDDTVEPGVVYYYNFTVVKTDLTESTPSGKIAIMSKDTMAPNVYHTPVTTATTGSNLVISATVTDNLVINSVTLYYRAAGTEKWNTAVMNQLNDKYSAIIPAQQITLDGIEYYLEAYDGNSFTYKGSAEAPYRITVREALDTNALGDVNGDGKISNLDALMLLQAINDLLNLTAEQFERADLNGDGKLVPAEALRILQYISGTVGSLNMQ